MSDVQARKTGGSTSSSADGSAAAGAGARGADSAPSGPSASEAAAERARRPKDRRERILLAAADLFARRGFVAVGVDDIAAEVGVTGPAIYRHFRNKQALLDELMLTTALEMAEGAEAVASEVASSGEDALPALTASAVGFALAEPHRLASYLRERLHISPESAPQLAENEARINRAWAPELKEVVKGLDGRRAVIRQRGMFGAVSVAASRMVKEWARESWKGPGGPAATPRRTAPAPRPKAVQPLLSDALLAALAEPVHRGSRASGGTASGAAAGADDSPRVEQIITAALGLFSQRGFAGVGIDEIGESVGITGSAVYRHYESKEAILVAAYDYATERMQHAVYAAKKAGGTPTETLTSIVRAYVRLAIDRADLTVVVSRELDTLNTAQRRRLGRDLRAFVEVLSEMLTSIRPELSPAEINLLVDTALAFILHASTAAGEFPIPKDTDRRRHAGEDLADEVEAMALAYLGIADA